MLPDDLEYRPKSDLIDFIVKQQAQIAELRTQLAQLQPATRRNGAALEAVASAAAVPAGQFPTAFRIILIAGAVLTCAILAIIGSFRPGSRVTVGRAQEFPPGSVIDMFVPSPYPSKPDLPIFLVNDPAAGFLALHARDPSSNCQVRWVPTVKRLEDPCSGSKYTRTGDYIEGPSPRGLDRYSVAVTESGEIKVDVSRLQLSATLVKVGRVEDFPPGSVTSMELPATFDDPDPPGFLPGMPQVVTRVSPIPIFLVHDPAAGFLALYTRDPHLGCRVKWSDASLRFVDPCHGSKYTTEGTYIEGPAPRGLDRFAVVATDEGEVMVDTSKFQLGPPSR